MLKDREPVKIKNFLKFLHNSIRQLTKKKSFDDKIEQAMGNADNLFV